MEKLSIEQIRVETGIILKDFEDHFILNNNKRILFSGPFGTGKSTFLKEFSAKKDKDFFYLKIFPVNYSVSSNEDVFELIKFDLLFQLMGQYSEEAALVKEDFTLLLKSQMFIMERMNYMPLLYAILGFSEKIGAPIVDFVKALEKTVGDYKAFSDEIKIDEEKDITQFLDSIQQKKGNHNEMDAVSELVFDLIGRIKNSKYDSQSVLIVDDLDRLDPEHIFRLFNIFSAHYDEIDGKNKFGFDKVIFVCDIENIRKIFHHKYGTGVDFSGYIDKFYSIAPFDFDNRKYIQEKVSAFISKLEFGIDMDSLRQFKVDVEKTLHAILICLIETNQLNLRMLNNLPKVIIRERSYKIHLAQDIFSTSSTPIIVVFQVLRNFYGSVEILKKVISNMFQLLGQNSYSTDLGDKRESVNYHASLKLLGFCLPFLVSNEMQQDGPANSKTIYVKDYNFTAHYHLPRYGDLNYFLINNITSGEDPNSVVKAEINSFKILLDTLEQCQKLSLL